MTQVKLEQVGSILFACIQGEVDHHWANVLRAQIDSRITLGMPQTLVLDFSAVTFMDSSGVGLILGRYKKISALGGTLVVQHAPSSISRMLAIAGIECKEEVHESR